MKNIFYSFCILASFWVLTGCGSPQTEQAENASDSLAIHTSSIPIDTYMRLRKTKEGRADFDIQFIDSLQVDDFKFYTFSENIGESIRNYTIVYGVKFVQGGFNVPSEFGNIFAQAESLGNTPLLIPGKVKAIEDITGNGKQDFLATDIYNENGARLTIASFWIQTGKQELDFIEEPQILSRCEMGCSEEEGERKDFPNCPFGYFSDYTIEKSDDNQPPKIIIAKTNVLADARCNNWGNVAEEKVYQYLGSDNMQFVFITDRQHAERELGVEGSIDTILDPFLGVEFPMISNINNEWVRHQICEGGIPILYFYAEGNDYYLKEQGYQDVIDYSINNVSVNDMVYTLNLDNTDMPVIKFKVDKTENTIEYNGNKYAIDPNQFKLVKEENCDDIH